RVGVDAVSVERMATAVRRSGVGFLAKTFTPDELAYCLDDPQRLAGRWAAKEAVIKCFDRTPICFRRGQIEVVSSDGGAPLVRLLVAETIYPILATKCTEVMATPLPEGSPGALGPAAYDSGIGGHLKGAASGVVGPGLGQADATRQLIYRLLAEAPCPLVVDA